jgi:hypothetical protein
MIQIIIYFVGSIFLAYTYYILTRTAIKNGLMLFVAEFLPMYLALLEAQAKSDEQGEAILKIIEDQDAGLITEEEASKILRNMRGE